MDKGQFTHRKTDLFEVSCVSKLEMEKVTDRGSPLKSAASTLDDNKTTVFEDGKRKLSPKFAHESPSSTDVDRQSTSDASQLVKRQKISFGMTPSTFSRLASTVKTPLSSTTTTTTPTPTAPISIKLGTQKPKELAKLNANKVVKSVSNYFNADDDDDDEAEEMPPEARMRMRNVGRDTPTSTGPNSFGKTSKGFCDTRSNFVKELLKSTRGHDPASNK